MPRVAPVGDQKYAVRRLVAEKNSLFFPLAFLFVMRILSALYAPMDDCDEVFNYWEPVHYQIFGHGLQTWEYSEQYALRSYAYLLLFTVFGRIYHISFSGFLLPLQLLVGGGSTTPGVNLSFPEDVEVQDPGGISSWFLTRSGNILPALIPGKGAENLTLEQTLTRTTLFYAIRIFCVAIPCFLSERFLVYSLQRLEERWGGRHWQCPIEQIEVPDPELEREGAQASRGGMMTMEVAPASGDEQDLPASGDDDVDAGTRRRDRDADANWRDVEDERTLRSELRHRGGVRPPRALAMNQPATQRRDWFKRTPHHLSAHLACVLATTPGMFIASSAMLPSTFFMIGANFVWGAWIRAYATYGPCRYLTHIRHTRGLNASRWNWWLFGTFASIATTLWSGWPFAALIFVAFALVALSSNRRRLFRLVFYAGIFAASLAYFVSLVDWYFYDQKPGTFEKLPLFNNILYNAPQSVKRLYFRDHPGGMPPGSELYGVEPMTFYVKNLFLNFNTLFICAVAAIPFVTVRGRWFRTWYFNSQSNRDEVDTDAVLFLTDGEIFRHLVVGLVAWLGLLSMLPHKEERFLFPVYPLICLYGLIGLVWFSPNIKSYWVASVPLSLIRIFAIVFYYSDPINRVWMRALTLSYANPGSTFCVGDQWHKFPSHFFLEPNARLHFLQTPFDGILPGHFPLAEVNPDLQDFLAGSIATAAKTNSTTASILVQDEYSPPEGPASSGGRRAASSPYFAASGALLFDAFSKLKSEHLYSKPKVVETSAFQKPDHKNNYNRTPKFNNQNKEEPDRYVGREKCDFIINGISKALLLSFVKEDENNNSEAAGSESSRKMPHYCQPVVDNSASRFPFRSFYFLPTESSNPNVQQNLIRKFLEFQFFCIMAGNVKPPAGAELDPHTAHVLRYTADEERPTTSS
ncbi:unnamed protein product [Amoebophrya sp. A120]|nr:unnamed protein product [Amoebophrya sp. A120]|eukprot:GSA120T00003812001.1